MTHTKELHYHIQTGHLMRGNEYVSIGEVQRLEQQRDNLLRTLELLHKNCCYQLSPDDDRPTHTPYYLFAVVEQAIASVEGK